MYSSRMFALGVVLGVGLGVSGVLLLDRELRFLPSNGVLRGWEVTRDNETLLCRDPIVYIRARQIECE